MNILIRADASVAIGTGHVMRCLTLAQALREAGASVSFICKALPGNLNDHIEQRGFRVNTVPLDENGDWEADARYAQAVITGSGKQPDWIITDHYGLDARWESALRPLTGHIMAIDDLADRPHDCDLLLDQNIYAGQATAYAALIPTHAVQLLGPQYALLRNEFAQARATIKPRDGSLRRILVFFGGSDPSNETDKVLTALAFPDFANMALDVVVGVSNPRRETIRQLCVARPNTNFYCQISNMAELMANADMSIGAGGSTTWERMALGLPTLVISVASNQEQISQYLDTIGAHQYLGKSADVGVSQIREAVLQVLALPETLRGMSAFGMESVDGQGAKKVVAAMMGGWA
jgi:UDP-2,4-diacetamido-2,4,6-trideoxy-beta-L-altropyranose hydrolase